MSHNFSAGHRRSGIECSHRILAKVSRPEVATQFLNPPPEKMIQKLSEMGKITRYEDWRNRHADEIAELLMTHPAKLLSERFLQYREGCEPQSGKTALGNC